MADAILLPITLTATLSCVVLNLWSDLRVGRAQLLVRRGRAEAVAFLAARQAAGSAFRGNALLVLILILLLELANVAVAALAVPAALFIVARAVLIARADATSGPMRLLGVSATYVIEFLLVLRAVLTTFAHLVG